MKGKLTQMSSMKKYIKTFELGFKSAMEYRVDFLLSIVSILFPIIIQIYIWMAVFHNNHDASVHGYSYKQLIVYSILSGIISKLVATGFEYDINKDIKDGSLNKFVVQPIGYFLYRISCFFGNKFFQFIIILFLLVCIILFGNVHFHMFIEFSRILIFIPAIFLSLCLNALIFFTISAAAFWVSDANGAFIILGLVTNVASGGVFPLEFFGKLFNNILYFLPFKYIIYFPINIINGKISFSSIYAGMGIQCFWILILYVLSKAVWDIGMKKYIAVGG